MELFQLLKNIDETNIIIRLFQECNINQLFREFGIYSEYSMNTYCSRERRNGVGKISTVHKQLILFNPQDILEDVRPKPNIL